MDNTNLLFALLENKNQTTDPVKFYGIDKSPICVARSLIIYEMLKNGSNVESIFELWYLSCISHETAIQLQKSIVSILNANSENLQKEVLEILIYWLDHSISIEDS